MKLASLKNGRDGDLIVVNKDLTKAVSAASIAPTLQNALDSWKRLSPQLKELSEALEEGRVGDSFPFNPVSCAAPLPRAYQWLDASAYLTHVERVRKSRGAEMPPDFKDDPLMYQGGSDCFLGPYDDIVVEKEEWGIDFEAEVAVITGDVPMAPSAEESSEAIKLIMLANDVSLRAVAQEELKKGFGFLQGKPPTAFSPVAITPDELGDAWTANKVFLSLAVHLNGKPYGSINAGVDMQFNFATLIAHAARTRPLCAGTILGSGTVSSHDITLGYSCLVEKRCVEKINTGRSETNFMKIGDSVRIEMKDLSGQSIFGAIHQTVRPYFRKP